MAMYVADAGREVTEAARRDTRATQRDVLISHSIHSAAIYHANTVV
jgi:hypothetical protein